MEMALVFGETSISFWFFGFPGGSQNRLPRAALETALDDPNLPDLGFAWSATERRVGEGAKGDARHGERRQQTHGHLPADRATTRTRVKPGRPRGRSWKAREVLSSRTRSMSRSSNGGCRSVGFDGIDLMHDMKG